MSQFPLDSLDQFDKICNESLKIIKEKIPGPKLSLKQRLWMANSFIEVSVQKMKRGDRINAQDQILIMNTLLMLVQFKVIDNDESNGYLICPKYKPKNKKRINNLK
tara:strand:+ start:158 stop:475 length:318 start_codon:yes stop_codon:yes gene_type:complete